MPPTPADAALVARLQAVLDGAAPPPGAPAAAAAAATAPPASATARHYAACAEDVLRRLVAHDPGLLRGLVPERVEALASAEGWGQVCVTLRDAAGPLRLYLSAATVPAAFQRGERFAVTFDEATPLATPARRHAALLLLRAMERAAQ